MGKNKKVSAEKNKNVATQKESTQTEQTESAPAAGAQEAPLEVADTEATAVYNVVIPDASPVDECVEHARNILAEQLVFVKQKNYDYAPEFRDMTTQLYLIGVMWKYAEGLENVTDARETAFVAIETMLQRDRMEPKKVVKRVEFLRQMSKMDDGTNALAVAVGYDAKPGDQSLVEVFEHFVDDVRVSGALWRLYDRGKKTMLYGGLFIAFVVIWFVTLFMPGNTTLSILAAGLISAALFVVPVFLVGLIIYHFKIKKQKQS